MRKPKVFISYSWDSAPHKTWVQDFARTLQNGGIEVILDQWHAVPGDQLAAFMDNAIRESDFVLLICTPNYKLRADSGAGGVGFEGHCIQGSLLVTQHQRKFIPVLRSGEWTASAPSALLGKFYIDLRGEPDNKTDYESNFHKLLGTLQGKEGCPIPLLSDEKEMLALVVGQMSETAKIFMRLTEAAGFGAPRHEESPRQALSLLEQDPSLGIERTLILLCTRPYNNSNTITAMIGALRRMRSKGEIIVYTDVRQWSGELAISCLQAGARDFLVQSRHDEIFREQIRRAKQKQLPYPYHFEATKGKAFIAMPGFPRKAYAGYDREEASDDYDCGICPAMNDLELQTIPSWDEHHENRLPLPVERDIKESALVIANISRYGRERPPNVALEIRCAASHGIPSIIIQRRDDGTSHAISKDLTGRPLFTYLSCADLTVQLYYGLRDRLRLSEAG